LRGYRFLLSYPSRLLATPLATGTVEPAELPLLAGRMFSGFASSIIGKELTRSPFFVNTHISSTIDKGRYLATANAPPVSLFQYHWCLKLSILDAINAVVNGWLAVRTIAPFGLITRSYSAHSGSNAITLFHLHAVVP